jgi:tRNA pseudouridine55 synthase
VLSGILLLNKQQGSSSNHVLQKAKRLYNISKAGHSGTLDPLATGMLPICFGEATKICQFLLNSAKCYQTTGLLGIKTNTADSTGLITSQVELVDITKSEITKALSKFKGKTKQIPSMFSALKHEGMPLYRYARKGLEIERKPREITIDRLQLDRFDGRHFSLTVVCSKGTYIRNLVEDIGDTLEVGAHVVSLHRVYTSGFEGQRMYTLDELQSMTDVQRAACLIPMDQAISYFEAISLTHDEVLAIRQGRVLVNKGPFTSDVVRLYDPALKFIGLGECQLDGNLKAKRLLAF